MEDSSQVCCMDSSSSRVSTWMDRCLESDGITAHETRRAHGTSPAEMLLQGPTATYRLIAGRKEGRSTPQRRRHTLSSLSASALSTRANYQHPVPTLLPIHTPHFLTVSLFIARLLVLSRLLRSSRHVYTICCIRLFAPACSSRLHLEFATSFNAQEEGRQGAGPSEAEGQGTECLCRRQASVDEEVCQKLR